MTEIFSGNESHMHRKKTDQCAQFSILDPGPSSRDGREGRITIHRMPKGWCIRPTTTEGSTFLSFRVKPFPIQALKCSLPARASLTSTGQFIAFVGAYPD
ncbi:hypothetical protein ABH944_006734 [Caballeronia udeis]|uniref:Uncharacterized protein n=1 Tax=Caballeronia udeis TaxID=1232866 RepID=A0ABW8MS48_9BURK